MRIVEPCPCGSQPIEGRRCGATVSVRAERVGSQRVGGYKQNIRVLTLIGSARPKSAPYADRDEGREKNRRQDRHQTTQWIRFRFFGSAALRLGSVHLFKEQL